MRVPADSRHLWISPVSAEIPGLSKWPFPCIASLHMSLVCKLWSVSGLLVAVVGLAGCYDLSDPTGPRPEDFARSSDSTEQVEQGQATDDPAPPTSEARAMTTGLEYEVGAMLAHPKTANTAQRKLRANAGDHD